MDTEKTKDELIGESGPFLRTMMDAIIRAKDNDPVIISGPTGSGKTGVAKAIHSGSLTNPSRVKPK